MVFQVITYPHTGYDQYRKGCDFIQKHIFPGGLCPSITAIVEAVESGSSLGFEIEDMENIGPHYATTLKIWRENFIANKKSIFAQGFDEEFFRKWIYYFSYCEAAFATRFLGDYQVILNKKVYWTPSL